MSEEKKHLRIVEHYNRCLLLHGDTHLGVDWPNVADAETRYRIMLDVILAPEKKATLLDFGCGASHMHDFILKNNLDNIQYAGLDVSKPFIDLSKRKYPSTNYFCMDVLDDHEQLPAYDYIVMNGVFTEKLSLSHEEMFSYFKSVITILYKKAKFGMAFNVMSKAVSWERDDLFHLSTDSLIDFLVENVSRNFVLRNDYGLYEYTTYVYSDPNRQF